MFPFESFYKLVIFNKKTLQVYANLQGFFML